MELSLRYGSRVAAIPADGMEEYLKSASRVDLAVLLSAAINPGLSLAERSEALDIPQEELSASIQYWEKKNVLSVKLDAGETLPSRSLVPEKPKKLQSADLPSYTTEETARILENSADISFPESNCNSFIM